MSEGTTAPPPGPSADPLYRRAVIAVLFTSVVSSSGGPIVRAIEHADPWQIVFYRSGTTAATLVVFFVLQNRTATLRLLARISPWGILGAAFLATAQASTVLAMSYTTIASALFILSALPLFTAVLARLVLGERVLMRTRVAMAVAMVGMAVMLWDGLGTGSMLGNLLAVLCTVAFAAYVVVLRLGRGVNMLPVAALGTGLASAGAAAMSGFDLAVPLRDAALAMVWGGGVSALAQVLFTFGTRHVPGAEVTLLVLVEFVLGPIWVWLLYEETATAYTLVGGALVIAAVAGRGVAAIASSRRGHAGAAGIDAPAGTPSQGDQRQ